MAEQRIQKVLSDQGVCSRRAAEKLIDEGRVKVNGHPVTLGDKMDPDFDKVSIDGKSVRIVRKRQYTYLMLNKPRGYITTTIPYDHIPASLIFIKIFSITLYIRSRHSINKRHTLSTG